MLNLRLLTGLAMFVPVVAFGGDWREGAGGYETAVFDQKQTGQPMLVYFSTSWCGYCRQLESKVLETKKARDFIGPFAKVKIDPESGKDAEMLARKFGVSGYPSVFVLATGKHPEKISASGAAGPDAFIAAIQRVTGGAKPAVASGKKPAAPAAEVPLESMKVNIPASLISDLPGDVVEMQAQGRHGMVVMALTTEIKRAERSGIRPKPAYLYARALSSRALRKHSEAAADLELYLAGEPDDVAARETLARSYLNVTMYDDAAIELEKLVKSHPTAERKFLLAEAYAKSGKTKEAKPVYAAACEQGYAPACGK